jgi:hypothetical protein
MPTPQQIFLYVNGTLSADQSALNMIAGPGLTIVPQVGGGVIFTATGGISPGSLNPYSGVPAGSIPGSTFTTPYALVMATVFVNGLALLPTSYTQSTETFTLTTALETGDSIFIQGFYS